LNILSANLTEVPPSSRVFYPEDCGSRFLRNNGNNQTTLHHIPEVKFSGFFMFLLNPNRRLISGTVA
jgi:hypothetical protein